MKRQFRGVLFGWCLVFVICALTANSAHAKQVSLTDLVVQTKQALLKVAQEGGNRLVLDHVTLQVQTVAEDKGGGKLSFWVVTIGGGGKQTLTSKMSLTLVPPDPESASNISKGALSDVLAAAILSAGDAIDAAMKGQPPLEATEFTAEVNFVLEVEGEAGVKLKFANVGLEAGGATKEQALQSIQAVFKRPK